MNYFQIEFDLNAVSPDLVFVFLSNHIILGIEEKEQSILCYTDQLDVLAQIQADLKSRSWEKFVQISQVPEQNWNKTWEENFDPVYVDKFCQVVADFHEPQPGFKYTIHLQPKMAFGTGHHETTFMMLRKMAKLDFAGAQVFDFGCGSGILAILAEKMGAASVYAIDNDPQAISNSNENSQHNKCRNIMWDCGTLEDVFAMSFDIVLANINRNVLLDVADRIPNYLNPGADLILSGILKSDEDLVMERYKKEGLTLKSRNEEGDWVCLHFEY